MGSAARVAELLGHVSQHLLRDPWVDGRRGVVVEVDRAVDWLGGSADAGVSVGVAIVMHRDTYAYVRTDVWISFEVCVRISTFRTRLS